MAKNPRTQKPQGSVREKIPFSAENEGTPLPISVINMQVDAAGNQSGHVDLNLHLLPAPRRRFSADAYTVSLRDDVVHMVFLQRRIDGEQVRAMVDIQMVQMASEGFALSLLRVEKPIAVAGPFPLVIEPDQTVSLMASHVRASSGAGGAVLDFYFASPFSLRAGLQSSQIHFEGEVRILTSAQIYEGFVDELRRLLKLPVLAPSEPVQVDADL